MVDNSAATMAPPLSDGQTNIDTTDAHAEREVSKYIAPTITLDSQNDDELFRDVIAYLQHNELPASRDSAK